MSFIKVTFALFCIASITHALPQSNAEHAEDIETELTKWMSSQEVSVDLPFGSAVQISARNLNEDEIDMKVQLSTGAQARKSSKLKKIFAPILMIVILKAITLIPLALGILGLKTWNAIQLSFVTFVTSIALAVFELCKKVAADHVHPVVSHSAPWPAARAMREETAENLAYSAYKP